MGPFVVDRIAILECSSTNLSMEGARLSQTQPKKWYFNDVNQSINVAAVPKIQLSAHENQWTIYNKESELSNTPNLPKIPTDKGTQFQNDYSQKSRFIDVQSRGIWVKIWTLGHLKLLLWLDTCKTLGVRFLGSFLSLQYTITLLSQKLFL